MATMQRTFNDDVCTYHIERATKCAEAGGIACSMPALYTNAVRIALEAAGWSTWVSPNRDPGMDWLHATRAAPAPTSAEPVLPTGVREYGAQQYEETADAIAAAREKASAARARAVADVANAATVYVHAWRYSWHVPSHWRFGDLLAEVSRAHASAKVHAGSNARAYLAAITSALAPAGVVPGDPSWLLADLLPSAFVAELAALEYWR